ncbi:hypothetical protein D3C80_579900 [compost metagenome]
MPLLWVLACNNGKPAWNASWENPPPASTRTIEGAWSTTSGRASATTLPALSELTHPSTRYRPWDAQPSRSPATMVSLTALAWSAQKPLCKRIEQASEWASDRVSRIMVISLG